MAKIVHLRLAEQIWDTGDETDAGVDIILGPIKLRAAEYTDVNTMAAATTLFSGQARPAVLSTDDTLLNQDNWQLRDLAFTYIHTGGTIVIIPMVGSNGVYIEEFVVKLGLPWVEKQIGRRDFSVNSAFRRFSVSSIRGYSCGSKAMHLEDVAREDSLLISPRNWVYRSDVPPGGHELDRFRDDEEEAAAKVEKHYVAAALAGVGQGRVGYVAECFGDADAVNVVLGMLGML
ncbi:hypothetical protein CLAFUW4_09420 [Fulvia fulva]|uniref:Uncharacterized protein n=1 Tax=Passalora fulva TaxID=5499 RepID=A0A9Q8UTS3_PASFU|nr:uncharacterized protein CLAFUR5_09517 [Fulvia fulva]KAK4614033.1 hypothetical protein CLAFUR4_09426 [Fulvia fulva]KAK4615183.1 hypothetical protein CLAFUR0_09417 [Fulvia fulva]UJO22120.1 hypothetical protein CLAFUR5_09517 [Fulvia fulva]WPV20637.1 hypothetical protein CLAFUW4_09420 [Fulvia fulva]WPV35581.1 hypothetical protein CLAFUW7_09421 [Fulvia fulva]